MNWLTRLPGFHRSAPGLEWSWFKRLPAIALWGSLLPAVLAVVVETSAGGTPWPLGDRSWSMLTYQLIGLVVLHWTLVLTMAIGCVIVMIMKGPAYVADPYPPPERDQPL